MLIRAKVEPASKKEAVTELPAGRFKVTVKAKAEKGAANKAAIEALASHFKVPAEKVKIVSGRKARSKTFKISG